MRFNPFSNKKGSTELPEAIEFTIPSGVSGATISGILQISGTTLTGQTITIPAGGSGAWVSGSGFANVRRLTYTNTVTVTAKSGTISGKDMYGNPISEVFALTSGTKTTVRAYNPAYQTTITLESGITDDSGRIGISAAFGLPRILYSTDAKKALIRCEVNNVEEATDPTLTGFFTHSGSGYSFCTILTNTTHDTTKTVNVKYWGYPQMK